jgi:hypothetical protein
MSVIAITPPQVWESRNPILLDSVPAYPVGCRYALYAIGTEYGVAAVNPDGQAYTGNVYGDEATARRWMNAQRYDG